MGLGIHLEFLHFNLCEIVSIFCHLYNHYYGWPESTLSLCGSRQQPYNWLLCPKWKHTLLSSSELPKHFDQINLSHFLKLFFMVSPCSTRVKYNPPPQHTLWIQYTSLLLASISRIFCKQRENIYNSYIFTVDQDFINFNTFVFFAFILPPLA